MRALTRLVVAACLLTAPTLAAAQTSPLAGTWILRAADELRPDGSRVPQYGATPQGILMIDADGRYSLQIFRADRPKFASGDKHRGTPEEYASTTLGMSTHSGRIAIDSATHTLTFRIALASFPNWEHTEQKRPFTLSGDGNDLSYQVPPTAHGDGTTAISVWRRATPGA
ncbi:MAG TPA: lipocalin-like domain-containing protein [Gemmatimonadaceae bacterium]|jgi:hypothetical protein|nr:lipocalin-like domain-containing protein [Gemmatimonadaceae bacterium]